MKIRNNNRRQLTAILNIRFGRNGEILPGNEHTGVRKVCFPALKCLLQMVPTIFGITHTKQYQALWGENPFSPNKPTWLPRASSVFSPKRELAVNINVVLRIT